MRDTDTLSYGEVLVDAGSGEHVDEVEWSSMDSYLVFPPGQSTHPENQTAVPSGLAAPLAPLPHSRTPALPHSRDRVIACRLTVTCYAWAQSIPVVMNQAPVPCGSG